MKEFNQLNDRDFRIFQWEDWEFAVGKTAVANDQLSIKYGHPQDFWFHIAGMAGSHVVARHPKHLARCPREVRRVAGGLAAFFSKARGGGTSSVHWTQWSQVYKRGGSPAGQVCLKKFESMQVKPLDPDLFFGLKQSS